MKKCIMISDSFKGSLSSAEICDIARECFEEKLPECELVCVPVADGGEGSCECFRQALGGKMITLPVEGPFGEIKEASYLQLDDGCAVVEMAAAAGLPPAGARRDPRKAGTCGVGQLIRHAAGEGNKKIILALGGSATNDGGCGAAAALGVKFEDKDGNVFVPVGETLSRIDKIDVTEARELLSGIEIITMCDIDNPMHGKDGAAYVFAPQKGADPECVEFLDGQLKALDEAIKSNLGLDISQLPGSGAAGAFGAGATAFLGARLVPGIEVVLDLTDFDKKLEDCSLVITGEGRVDSQSLRGKVIFGVAKRAKKAGVPVLVLAGAIADDVSREELTELGITDIRSINPKGLSLETALANARINYKKTLNGYISCRCEKADCPNHGNCAACMTRHSTVKGISPLPYCQRPENK